MRSCQMFVFTSLNTLTTLILSSLSLAFPPSQITSITTNYTEEFRYAGKNSRGSNQASLSGNLPPLENVSAICENYWIGERNQSTSLGGKC